MKKNITNLGFTLTELIGVIVLIAALMLLLVPVVDKQLKESKQKLYQKQIDGIKLGAQTFYSELNIKLDSNEQMKVYLSELKQANHIDKGLINPVTKKAFPNDMEIEIKNEQGIITYQVLENSGSDNGIYDGNTPVITLNGESITYINLNEPSGYQDLGANAQLNGNIIDIDVKMNTVDVTKTGIHTVVYKATNNGRISYKTRTVIVKDMEAPTITFPEEVLTVELNQISSYNFLSDVVVIDNSGETIIPTVESNFGAITGLYTIKYIAKDSVGNETIKFRNINVTN